MPDEALFYHPQELTVINPTRDEVRYGVRREAVRVVTRYVARDPKFSFFYRLGGRSGAEAEKIEKFESEPAIQRYAELTYRQPHLLGELIDAQHEHVWEGGCARLVDEHYTLWLPTLEAALPLNGNHRRVSIAMLVLAKHNGPNVVMSHRAGQFLVRQRYGVELSTQAVRHAQHAIVEAGLFTLEVKGRAWSGEGSARSNVFGLPLGYLPPQLPDQALPINHPSLCSRPIETRGINKGKGAPGKPRKIKWMPFPEVLPELTPEQEGDWNAWRGQRVRKRKSGFEEWKDRQDPKVGSIDPPEQDLTWAKKLI